MFKEISNSKWHYSHRKHSPQTDNVYDLFEEQSMNANCGKF